MKNRIFASVLVALATLLSACAGTDFVRPAEGVLVLGKSTQADVTAKMGSPYQTGDLTKNEKQLKVAHYAYASTGGDSAYPEVTPARVMAFTFYNDTLTSQEFISSFKQDSTDFDGSKVPSIVKGKSTSAEVIALFGKPTGEAIYPVIKGMDDRAYIYSYSQAKGSVFNMKFHQKSLAVSFNGAGVVTDVEYVSTGDR